MIAVVSRIVIAKISLGQGLNLRGELMAAVAGFFEFSGCNCKQTRNDRLFCVEILRCRTARRGTEDRKIDTAPKLLAIFFLNHKHIITIVYISLR